MGDKLVDLSISQGGRGVALQQKTVLTQAGFETTLGQSPDRGTVCSLYLKTNGDGAYVNATINFYVAQFGRLALWSSQTLTAAYLATQPALSFVASGFAADYWQVTITLTSGTTPAAPLTSSILASGQEDLPDEDDATSTSLSSTSSFVGPGGAGTAKFTLPSGTSVWIVTVAARVRSSGVDPVGDSYVTSQTYAWETTAGGVTTKLVPSILTSPYQAGEPLMATMVVPEPGVSGGQAEVTYTLPTGLDPSTITDVVTTLTPLTDVL
jgi:hypothetical protein